MGGWVYLLGSTGGCRSADVGQLQHAPDGSVSAVDAALKLPVKLPSRFLTPAAQYRMCFPTAGRLLSVAVLGLSGSQFRIWDWI